MDSYRFYVQQLCGFFEGYEFHHVPRASNNEADRLSKIGSTRQDIPAGVSLEIIRKPSSSPRRSLPPSTCPDTQPRLRRRHRTRGLPPRG
jgi:hypothetical protein